MPLADYLRGTGKTHGKKSDCGPGVGVLYAERLLKRVEILRVEDGGESGAVDGAVLLHCIFAHVAGVRHLLCEHNDVKAHTFSYY